MATYDEGFYDVIRNGAKRSVRAAVPILADLLGISETWRIVDVGCGEGWWSDGFAGLGCDVTGLDSGTTGQRPETFRFVEADLRKPLPPIEFAGYDLAVSLEVAEHLPRSRASTFVADLCSYSDLVLFSAARPGQGGTGHVNEQPVGYWSDLFLGNGYRVSGALRWHLWGHPKIENWYQQNLLVAVKDPDPGEPIAELFREPLLAYPHEVVHPILFDARRPQ